LDAALISTGTKTAVRAMMQINTMTVDLKNLCLIL